MISILLVMLKIEFVFGLGDVIDLTNDDDGVGDSKERVSLLTKRRRNWLSVTKSKLQKSCCKDNIQAIWHLLVTLEASQVWTPGPFANLEGMLASCFGGIFFNFWCYYVM